MRARGEGFISLLSCETKHEIACVLSWDFSWEREVLRGVQSLKKIRFFKHIFTLGWRHEAWAANLKEGLVRGRYCRDAWMLEIAGEAGLRLRLVLLIGLVFLGFYCLPCLSSREFSLVLFYVFDFHVRRSQHASACPKACVHHIRT